MSDSDAGKGMATAGGAVAHPQILVCGYEFGKRAVGLLKPIDREGCGILHRLRDFGLAYFRSVRRCRVCAIVCHCASIFARVREKYNDVAAISSGLAAFSTACGVFSTIRRHFRPPCADF